MDAKSSQQATMVADKMPKEERKRKWAFFIVGNLLTVGSVIYELMSLDLCFVGGEADRSSIGLDALRTSGDVEAYLVAALWTGAFYEALSAVVLSMIYSAPIDAKSAHKIPAEDGRGHCASFFVRFLTPFTWGAVSILLGLSSVRFARFRTCETNGGAWLTDYLLVSGFAMFFFGVFFLVLFMAVVLPIFAFCLKCGRTCGNRLLRTFPVIDVVWQLQGVIFGYRPGAFNVYVAVAVGVVEVVAACLSETGSFFPPPARVLSQAIVA